MADHRWPEPEIHAREALETDPLPTALARLRRLAVEHGWDLRGVTYARGTLPVGPLPWQPGPVVDSFVLRARRGPLRLVVTYTDGKFSTAWLGVDHVTRLGPVPLKAGQVKALLASPA